MPETIRLLRQEHANMAKLLDALERQIAVFDRGELPDYDIVEGVIDYCLAYPDLFHHPKEDLVYRRMQAREPAAAEAVGDLLSEHERLAALTRRLTEAVQNVLLEATVSRDAVDKVAREFLDAYRKHISMEEAAFFPAAIAALSEADWRELDAQAANLDDPLFGEAPADAGRFEKLRDDILAWDKGQAKG